mgnify:CR=1 FL=1
MSKGSKRDAARPESVIPCAKCPHRFNPGFRKFTRDELAFVQTFKIGELSVPPGTTVVRDGEKAEHLYSILNGWAMRYKLVDSGKRQILNFSITGDLVGLQSALFDKMLHAVDSLTELRLCVFDRRRMFELYQNHPGLAFDLTWLAAREESILADHLANVGQRSAFGRLAYVLTFLSDRAKRAGLARGNTLAMPITQEHLADTMGLSMVHTNKTLRRLQAAGFIEWRRQELTILDLDGLANAAEYDPLRATSRPFI